MQAELGRGKRQKNQPVKCIADSSHHIRFSQPDRGTGRTRNSWQAIGLMVKRLRRRANLSRVSARPLQRIAPMRVHATGFSILIQMDRAPLARSAGSNGAVLPRGAISEVYRAGPDFASRAVACRRIYSGPLKDGLRQADRHAGIRTGWSAYV